MSVDGGMHIMTAAVVHANALCHALTTLYVSCDVYDVGDWRFMAADNC